MLNPETRRRIDACRDILVGKIPDPKAQVEQITTALIYKFMYDMDAESEDLGGKPSFFTGKFKEYSWNKLMSKQLSGQDRMDLYVRATSAFGKAEHFPKLFRDIFDDAFLPYRDPETLNLFLKEVDGFKYEHSEDLGDAYEYLLSILGSQGDAGQFRTPRHIIEFIVDCVDPDVNDRILDPACGTAGFLISAYRHIVHKHDGVDEKGKPNKEKRLTKPERERLIKNLEGYDISPDMVRISRVNMYLHGFPVPKIIEYDSLTSEEQWDERFDVILANPPFMTPKGGIRPHAKFSLQANRSEVLFSDYIMEHLKPNGRAGFIVPEGIIFQSANTYKELRKRLVDDYGLFAVVSLPAGVFQPYSGVKTSILLIDKNVAKQSDEILFVKIENDGYDIGAQRRPTPEKNDLPKALEAIRGYVEARTIAPPFKGGVGEGNALTVKKEKIAASGDYNLSMDRYRETVPAGKQKWPMVKLGDVYDITSSKRVFESEWRNEGVPFYRAREIVTLARDGYVNNELFITEAMYHEYSAKYGAPKEDDLMVTGVGTLGICYRVKKHDRFYFKDGNIIWLKHLGKVNSKYVEFLFTSGSLKGQIDDTSGATVGTYTIIKAKSTTIPLPPLPVQEELVAELERLRKMAEGARAIIANYKPEIEIDPDWEIASLGDAVFFQEGPGILAKDFCDAGVPLVRLSGVQGSRVTLDGCNYLDPETVAVKWQQFMLNIGDIVITTSASFGNCSIVDETAKGAIFYTGLIRFKPKSAKLLSGYLQAFLISNNFLNQAESMATGSVIRHFGPSHLRQMTIPIPPLVYQDQIVHRLESERTEIEMLKRMVTRLEERIRQKVSAMWGE